MSKAKNGTLFLIPALLIIGISVFLTSCGTVTHYNKRPDFSKISMGMSQQEVVSIIGKPEDMSAQDGLTYLTYTWAPWYDHNGADGNKEYYFVRLINDRVESFGKRGDFDSTKNPTTDINIRTDSKIQTTVNSSGDLFTELTKLKALLDSGAITQDEYEALKARVISSSK